MARLCQLSFALQVVRSGTLRARATAGTRHHLWRLQRVARPSRADSRQAGLHIFVRVAGLNGRPYSLFQERCAERGEHLALSAGRRHRAYGCTNRDRLDRRQTGDTEPVGNDSGHQACFRHLQQVGCRLARSPPLRRRDLRHFDRTSPNTEFKFRISHSRRSAQPHHDRCDQNPCFEVQQCERHRHYPLTMQSEIRSATAAPSSSACPTGTITWSSPGTVTLDDGCVSDAVRVEHCRLPRAANAATRCSMWSPAGADLQTPNCVEHCNRMRQLTRVGLPRWKFARCCCNCIGDHGGGEVAPSLEAHRAVTDGFVYCGEADLS